MNYSATTIDLETRLIPVDKRKDVYLNGIDNMYPSMIDFLSVNSVTFKQCSSLFSKFVMGKGVVQYNDIIVNNLYNQPQRLYELLKKTSKDFINHGGYFVHVNYGLSSTGQAEKRSIQIIPFENVRVGKSDDMGYFNKFAIKKNWNDNKEKETWVYSYDPDVVLDQISREDGESIEEQFYNYNGQLYYYNSSNDVYPLSPFHACLDDAKIEIQAAKFKKNSLTQGFHGKMMVVTPPLADSKSDYDVGQMDKSERANHNHVMSERQAFKDEIQDFLGAENAGGAFHMEMSLEGTDSMDKTIMFQNVDSNINDKMFEYSENSASNNIRKCANNAPSILINANDGSVFDSGEKIYQSKLFYQEQTDDERRSFELSFKEILNGFKGIDGNKITITPLINELRPSNSTTD